MRMLNERDNLRRSGGRGAGEVRLARPRAPIRRRCGLYMCPQRCGWSLGAAHTLPALTYDRVARGCFAVLCLAQLATKARSGLNRLERLVEDLETDLGDADMGLSRKELQRRRRLLNTLSREVVSLRAWVPIAWRRPLIADAVFLQADLRKAEGRKVQTAERESLMRPGGGSSRGGRGAGYGSGGSDDDPHAGMTNRDMLQAQRDGMASAWCGAIALCASHG